MIIDAFYHLRRGISLSGGCDSQCWSSVSECLSIYESLLQGYILEARFPDLAHAKKNRDTFK